MTIGRKEALEIKDAQFPAITVCPFADKQSMNPIVLVDPMSESDMGHNFTHAIESLSVKPVVHNAFYKVMKWEIF